MFGQVKARNRSDRRVFFPGDSVPGDGKTLRQRQQVLLKKTVSGVGGNYDVAIRLAAPVRERAKGRRNPVERHQKPLARQKMRRFFEDKLVVFGVKRRLDRLRIGV